MVSAYLFTRKLFVKQLSILEISKPTQHTEHFRVFWHWIELSTLLFQQSRESTGVTAQIKGKYMYIPTFSNFSKLLPVMAKFVKPLLKDFRELK